jgi:hypothetical protein
MFRKLLTKLLLLLSFLSFILPLQAQHRKAILPDYATLQYAGSIGFVSGGFGYRNGRQNLESELLAGYLPPSIGGDRLFTAALKSNWMPLVLFRDKPIHFYPLHTGLMLTYTFGDQFFERPPSHYPKGYYTFSTAIHAYWQFGSRLSLPLQNRRLEVYYELNASAEEIVSMIQNPRFLTPDKIFSLAIGVKLNFEP